MAPKCINESGTHILVPLKYSISERKESLGKIFVRFYCFLSFVCLFYFILLKTSDGLLKIFSSTKLPLNSLKIAIKR